MTRVHGSETIGTMTPQPHGGAWILDGKVFGAATLAMILRGVN